MVSIPQKTTLAAQHNGRGRIFAPGAQPVAPIHGPFLAHVNRPIVWYAASFGEYEHQGLLCTTEGSPPGPLKSDT